MEIETEKKIVEVMIRLYCKKKEKNKELCPACKELLEYATTRLDKCPFRDKKGVCKNCNIHCYKPEMRERIKTVMRFSGPRLIFHYPIIAIRHLFG